MSFIPGNYNVRADQLSKGSTISTEWSFSERDFHLLLKKLSFVPRVDLFSTDLNRKCRLYRAQCPDHRAVAVDSFSNSWDSWVYLYLFPPTPVISKALVKLSQSVYKKALLVCPQLVGRPRHQNLVLFNKTSFDLSLVLHQMVNGEMVYQERPTGLVALVLSGSTIQEFTHSEQSN